MAEAIVTRRGRKSSEGARSRDDQHGTKVFSGDETRMVAVDLGAACDCAICKKTFVYGERHECKDKKMTGFMRLYKMIEKHNSSVRDRKLQYVGVVGPKRDTQTEEITQITGFTFEGMLDYCEDEIDCDTILKLQPNHKLTDPLENSRYSLKDWLENYRSDPKTPVDARIPPSKTADITEVKALQKLHEGTLAGKETMISAYEPSSLARLRLEQTQGQLAALGRACDRVGLLNDSAAGRVIPQDFFDVFKELLAPGTEKSHVDALLPQLGGIQNEEEDFMERLTQHAGAPSGAMASPPPRKRRRLGSM